MRGVPGTRRVGDRPALLRQVQPHRLAPFRASAPAIAVTLPFFVFIFAAFVTGLLIGGSLIWLSQGRNRKGKKA